jgi:hypothetical protein
MFVFGADRGAATVDSAQNALFVCKHFCQSDLRYWGLGAAAKLNSMLGESRPEGEFRRALDGNHGLHYEMTLLRSKNLLDDTYLVRTDLLLGV